MAMVLKEKLFGQKKILTNQNKIIIEIVFYENAYKRTKNTSTTSTDRISIDKVYLRQKKRADFSTLPTKYLIAFT